MKRRVRLAVGIATMTVALSGCQVMPGFLYPNHGFPFCSLQSGPEPYPGEVFGGVTECVGHVQGYKARQYRCRKEPLAAGG